MPLGPGARFGPYEVTGLLGAGGVGEVYRARDTRLKREVALKILSASFAADPDRLARFQREAEVLASLNHPNIAAIHGVEDSGSVAALVLELVEGETLGTGSRADPFARSRRDDIAKADGGGAGSAAKAGGERPRLKPCNVKVRPMAPLKSAGLRAGGG